MDEDRQCPVCGATEQVAEEAVEWAVENGWPDEWVCTLCWLSKELSFDDNRED